MVRKENPKPLYHVITYRRYIAAALCDMRRNLGLSSTTIFVVGGYNRHLVVRLLLLEAPITVSLAGFPTTRRQLAASRHTYTSQCILGIHFPLEEQVYTIQSGRYDNLVWLCISPVH